MSRGYGKCKLCGRSKPKSRKNFPTCYECSKREGGEDVQSINDYRHEDENGDELSEALEYLEAWE